MPAPEIIRAKARQFRENKEQYRSVSNKRTPTRIGFINLLFEALGRDVTVHDGLPGHQIEVIYEYMLGPEAPDYWFRIGLESKFFVEAKKQSVHLATAYAGNARSKPSSGGCSSR